MREALLNDTRKMEAFTFINDRVKTCLIDHYLLWMTLRWRAQRAEHEAAAAAASRAAAAAADGASSGFGRLGLLRPLDFIWHAHILRTRDYEEWCVRHFGAFVHHQPDIPGGPLFKNTLGAASVLFGASWPSPRETDSPAARMAYYLAWGDN